MENPVYSRVLQAAYKRTFNRFVNVTAAHAAAIVEQSPLYIFINIESIWQRVYDELYT